MVLLSAFLEHTHMSNDTLEIQRRQQFGAAIARIRKDKHISQEQLALMAGIDRSYMGRIERGEQSISLDKIWSIADALNINPALLFM